MPGKTGVCLPTFYLSLYLVYRNFLFGKREREREKEREII